LQALFCTPWGWLETDFFPAQTPLTSQYSFLCLLMTLLAVIILPIVVIERSRLGSQILAAKKKKQASGQDGPNELHGRQ